MTVGLEYKVALSRKDETIPRLVTGGRASGIVIGEGCRGARSNGLLEPPNNLIAAMFEVDAAP